jgi:hypothetical protein
LICIGQSVDLSASGATTYNWNNGLGAGASHTVAPTTTTIYTVTGTNGGTCSGSANIQITVNDLPNVTVNASALTICEGDQVSLAANGADSYTWSPGAGLSSTTGASIVASPTVTTAYTVTGTNSCGSDSENITVFVNAAPATPVITQTGNDLSITLQPGQSAVWYYNGDVVGNGPVITMLGDGNYEVVVTNSSDCSSSASGEFVRDTTSLDENDWSVVVNIFPNPSNGQFELFYNAPVPANVWVTDAIGRRVSQTHSIDGQNSIIEFDLSSLQKGVYMVVIQTEVGLTSRKVTIN